MVFGDLEEKVEKYKVRYNAPPRLNPFSPRRQRFQIAY